MYKRKSTRKTIRIAASITAVLLVMLSIAFAALQQTLNISFGSVTQTAMTWGVGFKGTSATPTTEGTSTTGLSCGTASITTSTVTINQSTLSKPGDKCTYSLTVENTGDVPAIVSSISQTQPNSTSCTISGSTMVCDNITYKITKSDGSTIDTDTIINNGDTLDLTLTVSYTGTELSSTGTTQSGGKITLIFKQSDESDEVEDSYNESEQVSASNKTICKRATTLHTEECTAGPVDSCYDDGYYSGGAMNKTTITYGSLGTSGTLSVGDAFDCDVNGDGKYNTNTERFYYVFSPDGDTTNEYALLIYSHNVNKDAVTKSESIYYDSRGINYRGPITAYNLLPTVAQWPNVSLISQSRQIYNESGGTTTDDGNQNLPVFTYTGKAARIPTLNELKTACGITNPPTFDIGELALSCTFLLDNTTYGTGGVSVNNNPTNYWLETPRSTDDGFAFLVDVTRRYLSRISTAAFEGVRPVIEVKKVDIAY